MTVYEVILIGVALAIDACALTIANCASYKGKLNKRKEWAMPVTFALFQGVMPLIGFFIGSFFAEYISYAVKFISAAIFFALAFKVIFDVFRERRRRKERRPEEDKSDFTLTTLFVQAIATSIDALAVGVTFIGAEFSVYAAVAIIAAITFALVAISLLFGKTLGKIFGNYAQFVGAAILLGLAVKSLVEVLS